MIVCPEGDRLLIVTQPDHAHLAGELLALWCSDGLPEHPLRSEILFAAREHDNGWREADAAPRVDAGSGRPHDFRSMPHPVRLEVWRRGTARFTASHPYAALLIVEHALHVNPELRGSEEGSTLMAELAELRGDLLAATATREEELAVDYRLLDLADLASLIGCNRWHQAWERSGYRLAGADGTLHLDPFPLAGATTFRVPCRSIPDRRYTGDADLGGELAAAAWREVRLRLAPPP